MAFEGRSELLIIAVAVGLVLLGAVLLGAVLGVVVAGNFGSGRYAIESTGSEGIWILDTTRGQARFLAVVAGDSIVLKTVNYDSPTATEHFRSLQEEEEQVVPGAFTGEGGGSRSKP